MRMLKARGLMPVVGIVMILCAAARGNSEDFAIGAIGGYGFTRGLPAETTAGATARAGVRNSTAAGFFLRDEMYANISGEFRYLYRWGAHKVSNDTATASLGAHSHIFHYDLLFHTKPVETKYRPFFAIGAGGRVYQGTGAPPRTQPLSNIVLLRKANETKPLISLGGGVRWTLRGNTVLQLDVRDYFTQAPRKLFAPSATSTVSGWLHDFVPQISVAVKF